MEKQKAKLMKGHTLANEINVLWVIGQSSVASFYGRKNVSGEWSYRISQNKGATVTTGYDKQAMMDKFLSLYERA